MKQEDEEMNLFDENQFALFFPGGIFSIRVNAQSEASIKQTVWSSRY